jgi:hypothetical protein
MAMLPLAPGRFSITTGWPSAAVRPFLEQPRGEVGAAAGRVRHDHGDGARGEGALGAQRGGRGEHGAGAEGGAAGEAGHGGSSGRGLCGLLAAQDRPAMPC